MNIVYKTLVVFFITLLIWSCEPTTSHSGKVIKVKDGDSIVVLDSLNQQIEIRLAYIDAPEIGQDFSKVSKKYLSDLIFDKQVTYKEVQKPGRYGRVIAEITLPDGTNVNKKLVAEGMAWHYINFSGGKTYEKLEEDARSKYKGLWGQFQPEAPWEYRLAH
ncbi:MAG: thermonuclease family protein [Bacteroidetes bacterium]|nr:thermonuclease family protein [Bacteroidota bacterium]